MSAILQQHDSLPRRRSGYARGARRSHARPRARQWLPSLLAVLCLAVLAAGCRRSTQPPPGVLATVNGQPVTESELNRLYAEQTAGASAPLPPVQALQLRLSLLNQLIDRHILLQYAAAAGITADPRQVGAEVDVERSRQPNLSRAELTRQVSNTLVIDALMKREVSAKVDVTDADIQKFYQDNQASFHLPEPQYHVLEIVVTPHPGPVSNLAEDKAATPAEARKKMRMLQAKLKQNADFSTLAEQYSEDPSTASSGGDLGLIPQSVLLTQTSAPLRKAILALQPGQVSPIIYTPSAYYLLKLVDIEPAGVRSLSDPQVRQSIKDLLGNTQEQVLQSAFLAVVRDQARVVNYYARQVLAKPAAMTAAAAPAGGNVTGDGSSGHGASGAGGTPSNSNGTP